MTYFENLAIADIPGLIDELKTRLIDAGWTNTQLNASNLEPATQRVTREEVFQAPGFAPGSGNAASHYIDIAFLKQGTGVALVNVFGWLSQKPAVVIDTVTQSAGPGATTLVSVSTIGNHLFTTGDLVLLNGVSAAALNQTLHGSAPGYNKITVTGPTTFTFQSDINQDVSGTGGTAIAIYNFCGTRDDSQLQQNRLVLTNGPMDVVGYVDEFRICGVVTQGGIYFPFFLGTLAREHVQAEASDVAKLTGPVTGDGATPQILTLDRSSPNLYVGQTIHLVPPDSAVPSSINQAESTLETVTITQVDSPTQIRAVLSANTFPTGTVVGQDPMPLAIMGSNTSAVTSSLSSKTVFIAHQIDGQRLTVTQMFPGVEGNAYETHTDPDGAGNYQALDIFARQTAAGFPSGKRGPMRGMVAWPIGTQVDRDIMRTGNPLNMPNGDYRLFVGQIIDSVYGVSIGPGATP